MSERAEGIWLAYPVLRERLELDRDVFVYNVRDLIMAIFLPVAAPKVEAQDAEAVAREIWDLQSTRGLGVADIAAIIRKHAAKVGKGAK